MEVAEAHGWARDRTLSFTGGAQVPWLESTVVGRESIWLAGDPSRRKRAEQAILEGLENLPSEAVMRVDGFPRGAGPLEPGPRRITVDTPGTPLLDVRVRAREGRVVSADALLERRRSAVLLGLVGGVVLADPGFPRPRGAWRASGFPGIRGG